MKQMLFVIAIVSLVALTVLACKGSYSMANLIDGKPVPTGKLIKFYYVERGTMAEPNFEYTLKRGDKGVSLCVYRPWSGEGWRGDTISVPDDVIAHVEKLIKDNNLQNYKREYRPDGVVYDGYSWSYDAEFDDESVLSSGGYNARPGDKTLEVIAQYLDSCYAQVKGLKLER